ncbi:restriction endonuclease subunit S [Aliarcobacter cryaerophilus]|uniref:restriction endonuclease subunit S n=1 Tax=Aliarcobacter cryaerophilus TaxID=28198 RepID=UPI003DA3C5CB
MKTVKLSECLSKIIDHRGKTPKKLGSEWLDSKNGYRAISANNVKFNGLEKIDTINYGDEELYQKWMKEKVIRNDLLLTSEAPAGQVMLWDSDEQIILSQRLFALRTNDKYDSKYLKYYLQSSTGQSEINKNTSGSTVFGISAKMFDLINVFDLEIEEQIKIGEILYNIDKKIELNNKINKELESMAKTLYDYWFVQFDFPDENGKPYKSSGGKMVYNQELKRDIPQGWEVKTISEFIGNNKGGDWGKEQEEGNYTQKVSCIRGADLNGLNGLGELNPPERFILDKNSNKILESHDLIVEISGGSPTQSTGRLSFVIDETITRFENPLICSNFCKSFSLKNSKHFYYFIYMWNNLYDNSVLFGWEGKTSGIKNLLFDSFTQKYFVVVPNESINQKFYEKINSFHKMKQKKLKENQELAKLRDWLLPMLMNGQVRVK